MQCGKPNCACATDRASQHGPYYQLSWKEKGKTVSRRLPAEHATLYRQWIANRQRLQSIIQQMHGVSQKAHRQDRKSTRLNSSHGYISYAVFCLKKKNKTNMQALVVG